MAAAGNSSVTRPAYSAAARVSPPPTALATSMITLGPMVEVSETFLI
jgi:hypothetical protein